jgi:hypothetical protein
MEDAIAQTEIQCVSPSGDSFTSILRVGRPRLDDRGMWSCSLSMDGLFREDRPLFGDDSLQAFCLATDFARSQLQDFVLRGGQLFIGSSRNRVGDDSKYRARGLMHTARNVQLTRVTEGKGGCAASHLHSVSFKTRKFLVFIGF